jgi:hypothetical protein
MRWYLLIVRGDIVELKGPFPSHQARNAYARSYCHTRGNSGWSELAKLDIDESGIPNLERLR